MKRFFEITLSFVVFVLFFTFRSSVSAANNSIIKIGDYVQMGKYNDEPILWRCVDSDENGPLMLSDKILTVKAFDAAGNHIYSDGTAQADNKDNKRTSSGSNLWETSNMRSWLNSNATTGNIVWPDSCPPTEDGVFFKDNPYDQEKGFLAEGNFTASEQNTIKSVTQKSLLNQVDVQKLSMGGTVLHSLELDITGVVKNYDTAYYHTVTDKMFLLDVKQLNKLYQNKNILGAYYYQGQPTQKAIDSYNYRYDEDTLLRTPDTGSYDSDSIRVISLSSSDTATKYDPFLKQLGEYLLIPPEIEVVYGREAYYDFAVRPAFYIDLSSANFASGNGSVHSPYIVSENATNEGTFKLSGTTAQQSNGIDGIVMLYIIAGVLAAVLLAVSVILPNFKKIEYKKNPLTDVKTDPSDGKNKEQAAIKRFYQNTINTGQYQQNYKGAFGIIYFLGGANLVLSLIYTFFKANIDEPGLNIPFMITFGLIFLVLGFFVQRKSNIALLLAITVYAWDALRAVVIMLIGHTLYPLVIAGLFTHVIFIIPMINGISAIHHLNKTYYRRPNPVQAKNQLVGCITSVASLAYIVLVIYVGFTVGLKGALALIGAFVVVVIATAIFQTMKVKRLGLDNILITLVRSSSKIEGEEKIYEIELLFDNKILDTKSITIGQALRHMYLTAGDGKKPLYRMYDQESERVKLPYGKTHAIFEIVVKKNVVLHCLYIKNKAAIVIPENGEPSYEDQAILHQIESEQRKSRNRGLTISCLFFVIPLIIIAIFIAYLILSLTHSI